MQSGLCVGHFADQSPRSNAYLPTCIQKQQTDTNAHSKTAFVRGAYGVKRNDTGAADLTVRFPAAAPYEGESREAGYNGLYMFHTAHSWVRGRCACVRTAAAAAAARLCFNLRRRRPAPSLRAAEEGGGVGRLHPRAARPPLPCRHDRGRL